MASISGDADRPMGDIALAPTQITMHPTDMRADEIGGLSSASRLELEPGQEITLGESPR